MTDKFRTEITADPAQYNAAMDGAAQKAMTTAQAMASSMRESSVNMGRAMGESVKGMNAGFDSLKSAFLGVRGLIASVAAGGLGFGKMITDTARATQETALFAQALGISTEEAMALRIALDDIEVKTEDYTSMMSKMISKLRENEERFNELGIKTRGANGELLDTAQIMRNALAALDAFKAGTDRNLASSEIFGRGWNEVNKLMRLTPEVAEQARQKMEALQRTVGPEGAERARQFRLAMNEVNEVGEALANRIGQALMPVLTDLGNWLASGGPAAVFLLRGAFGGLVAAVQGFMMSVRIAFNVAASAIYSLVEPIAAVVEAAALAMTGDFSAAGERLKQISANVSANWKSSLEEIAESARKTRGQLQALFDPEAEQGKSAPAKEEGSSFEPDSRKGRMGQWEAALAIERDSFEKKKLLQGSFEQFSKEAERDFWKVKLGQVRDGSEEQAAILKKIYTAEREIRKQTFDAEVADLKAQMAAEQTTAEQRINLAVRVAEITKQAYGRESKEYIAALAEVQKKTDEWAKQQMQLRDLVIQHDRAFQLSRLEMERDNLDTLEKLGQISAEQKLERLKELAEIEYQVKLDALQKEFELRAVDEVSYKQQLERIEDLKRGHAANMNKIDNQMKVESIKVYNEIADAITGAFSTAFKGVMMGTQTLTEAMRNMGQSILLSLLDMGIKALAQHIKVELAKTFATTTGTRARTSLEAGAAAETTAVKTTEAYTVVGANAAEAASGAAASQASIPYVGWALAAAAFAAVMAMVLSARSQISSAAGGFNIPTGVNPIAQLHQEEMVLPADIANPLRESLAGGGAGGSRFDIRINAVDARSVERLFRDHGSALMDSLRDQERKFNALGRR